MIYEEERMIEIFDEILETYEHEEFLLVFEDKTKAGLDCKPHYHYYIEIYSELKSDTIRRQINLILEHNDIIKDNKQIKTIPVDNKDKCLVYLCKQQQIIYTSLSEEQQQLLLVKSKEYQEKITHYSYSELIQKAIEECILEKYMGYHIIETVHKKIYDHNKSVPYNFKSAFPTAVQMEQIIIYVGNMTSDYIVHEQLYYDYLNMTQYRKSKIDESDIL